MKELSEPDIERLFSLCRLAYSPEEKKAALQAVAKIIQYIDRLIEVPTDGVEPCVFVVPLENQGREDRLNDPDFPLVSRDEFLKAAPAQTAGMVRVPPVMTP